MINLLDRYILRTALAFMLITSLLLLGIDGLMALVREMKSIGKGDYTLLVAIEHVALTLPRRLYNMFPMAALLGGLIGLGQLANHSELIVMRASGMSIGRVAKAVLLAGLILTVLVTLMGEFIMPKSEYLANAVKASAKAGGQAYYTASGAWLRDGQNFIHIDEVTPDGDLRNVSRYVFDEKRKLTQASIARSARYKKKQWHLTDVRISDIQGKKIVSRERAIDTWPAKVSLELLSVLVRDPEDVSMRELWIYIEYLQQNGLSSEKYRLAFWQKLFQPLTIFVMVFLTVPFIFGPLREVTMGVRLVAGVLVGFSFYVLNKLFGPLTLVYGVSPIIGALLPSLLFTGLALFVLSRAR